MPKILITAASPNPQVIQNVLWATTEEKGTLQAVYILDTPQSSQVSREALKDFFTEQESQLNFYCLPSANEDLAVIHEAINSFFISVLTQYKKDQIIVDLTAGTKAISQVLYVIASEFGVREFQILAIRYLGKSNKTIDTLERGKDYELQSLPAIELDKKTSVEISTLPLETRVRLDSELILRCSKLLSANHYDEAVVNAFKILDQRIRTAIGESHDIYGEELINRAFAPQKGKLSQGLTSNEKAGLRNLISGANAFFRNPSAHRFVDYDQVTGETIIILVNFFLNMVEVAQGENSEV